MDEMERKTRLEFRENFGNFLKKICGEAEEGEKRCSNFWVSETCFKFQTTERKRETQKFLDWPCTHIASV